jgi:hypothetical protein
MTGLDLASLWGEHCRHEFETRGVDDFELIPVSRTVGTDSFYCPLIADHRTADWNFGSIVLQCNLL